MPISEYTSEPINRSPTVHIPGAYQHLLDRAQRDHDNPDPRALFPGAAEREQLTKAAQWRKPSARHAKLLAGEPVVVRKYAAIPPSRKRQNFADAEWLNDPDIVFVTVTRDDMVCPGDERDYLAPGPAPE